MDTKTTKIKYTRSPYKGVLGIILSLDEQFAKVITVDSVILQVNLIITIDHPEYWEGDFIYVTTKGKAIFAKYFKQEKALKLLNLFGACDLPAYKVNKYGKTIEKR
jgi:hypothetical protein